MSTKLTTLDQLKTSLQSAKTYIDAQDAGLSARIDAVVEDVEGIVATGGEANILEGVKVNGTALSITDKMVDILIESGDENGQIKVNGVGVAVAGLAKLAYAEEITEAELSEALKASIAAKATDADLQALTVRVETAEGTIEEIQGDIEALQNAGYQTEAQVRTLAEGIAAAAVAASGHAHFEKVDAIPTAETAEENVLYLVMNETTGHYDIYALVSGSVERIDDTTVDLSNYSTTEQMNGAISAAIEALKIGDYAKAADLNAAVERITAVEAKFNDYYTKTEMDGLLAAKMDVSGMGAYATDEEAAAAASAAVSGATATDAEVQTMLGEVFPKAED